jgi:hypothetical protein
MFGALVKGNVSLVCLVDSAMKREAAAGHSEGDHVSNNGPEWYHCSSYGTVLMHIAANPHSTTSEIAEALCLTKRSVWGAIGVLRQSEQIHVYRVGRRNHYYVNLDAPFRHPTVRGLKLRDLLEPVAAHHDLAAVGAN